MSSCCVTLNLTRASIRFEEASLSQCGMARSKGTSHRRLENFGPHRAPSVAVVRVVHRGLERRRTRVVI